MKLDFDKYKDDRYAIHCDSQEKANILVEVLDKLGREWNSGRSYAAYSFWNDYKENTVYYFNKGKYGKIGATNRRFILEFDDFDWDGTEDIVLEFDSFIASLGCAE